MTTQASIINRLTKDLLIANDDWKEMQRLQGAIPGWSTQLHMLFFKCVLAEAKVRRILVCGVYHGLDLAILEYLIATYHRGQQITLTGIDLFSDGPMKDWGPEKHGMTWEQAANGPPPSLSAAQKNAPTATIHKADSKVYLAGHRGEFDFIYLDTSHDEQTVRNEIEAIGEKGHREIIIAGDDYRGPENWGVDKAVDALLPAHAAVFDRLWIHAL